MTHSIIVIDDHEIAHSALRLLITDRSDLHLERCFRQAEPAISYLQDTPADIVVLDLDLPDKSGVEVLGLLHGELGLRVLVLSGSSRREAFARCRKAGAAALVSKGDRVEETLTAIDRILAGEEYMSPGVQALLKEERQADAISLSSRQEEILELVTKGMSNKEISYELGIAQPTVSFHLRELSKKLGADHPRQLVARAKSAGIL